MQVFLKDVVPAVGAAVVVLSFAWRSQTVAFVSFLFAVVAANSSVHWIQWWALSARWGALAAIAVSVLWTLPLRWPARPPRPLALTLGALVAFALLSVAWSSDPRWTLLRSVSFGTLLWSIFAGVRPALTVESEARRLARGIAVLVVAVLVASLACWAFDPDGAIVGNQLRGVFNNPSDLPLLLGLTYPLVVSQFDDGDDRHYLTRAAPAAFVAVVFIALCQSRAGLVAFLVGVGVYELLRGRFARIVVPLAAIGVVTGVALAWRPHLSSGNRTTTGFDSPGELLAGPASGHQSLGDRLLSGRNEAWAKTLHLIGHAPAVGHGFGTADKLFTGVTFRHFVGFSPHNGYLSALLELGVLGAPLLLVPLGLALVRVLSATRRRGVRPEVAAFAAVLAGGMIDGIFEDVFEAAGSPFAPLIWLSCAVVLVRVVPRAPASKAA